MDRHLTPDEAVYRARFGARFDSLCCPRCLRPYANPPVPDIDGNLMLVFACSDETKHPPRRCWGSGVTLADDEDPSRSSMQLALIRLRALFDGRPGTRVAFARYGELVPILDRLVLET